MNNCVDRREIYSHFIDLHQALIMCLYAYYKVGPLLCNLCSVAISVCICQDGASGLVRLSFDPLTCCYSVFLSTKFLNCYKKNGKNRN